VSEGVCGLTVVAIETHFVKRHQRRQTLKLFGKTATVTIHTLSGANIPPRLCDIGLTGSGLLLNTPQHTEIHAVAHCNTLQHTALQHTATHCNTNVWESNAPQHTITYCNTLQHTTARYNTLQYTGEHMYEIATHCNTMQHSATNCNTLRHTSTHCNTYLWDCNTLQNTTTQCNTL